MTACAPHPDPTADPVRLVVCIATYHRPEGLSRLLHALAACDFASPAPHVEVVVIDNDALGSARSICEAAREWLPWELHYSIEKRRGIPQARNAALAIAIPRADFIAFTDDDTRPSSSWLAELLRVQRLYDADVVAGPNPPHFLETPPAWIVAGGFFEGPRRATGTPIDTAATHNVLLRRTLLEQMDRLFDERFGLGGSDDSEFFARVARAGHRMIWADDAVVHECIPASRATLRWLLKRAYRIANALARPPLRDLNAMTRFDVAHSGLRCLGRGALGWLLGLRRGPVQRVQSLRVLAAGAGWLSGLVGIEYREYREIHGR